MDRSARPSPFRWLVITVLIALVLGLATTVGVSWGLASMVPIRSTTIRNAQFDLPGLKSQEGFSNWLDSSLPPSTGVVASDGDHVEPWLIRIERFGSERVIWFAKKRIYSLKNVGPDGASGAAVACWSFATSTRGDPRFPRGEVALPASIGDEIARGDPMICWGAGRDARGWPLPALSCDFIGIRYDASGPVPGYVSDPFALYDVRHGIRLDALANSRESLVDVRVLPTRPEWAGLLANTAVFASGWWVLLLIPRVVFRRARAMTGHCADCGYSLKGLSDGVCPECGVAASRASEPDSARSAD